MASSGDKSDVDPNDKGYKAPTAKTIQELNQLDAEDESLRRYKEQLLGSNAGNVEPVFPEDSRNFIPKCVRIMVKGSSVAEIDLTNNTPGKNKKRCSNDKTVVKLQEGTEYTVEVDYFVQREILSGLKYIQCLYKGPLKVDTETVMLGSYPPKSTIQTWKSPVDEAPKGLVARGSYAVKSRFVDDDKQEYLSFNWTIEIVKGSGE